VRIIASFSPNGAPKNEGTIDFTFGGRFGVSQRAWKAACAALWWFFHQIKVRQQIERMVSICRLLKNEEIREIFVLSSKELLTLFQNSKLKFENLIHIPLVFTVLS
jgi:hypothetical protein